MKFINILLFMTILSSTAWCEDISLAKKYFYSDQYKSASELYLKALENGNLKEGALEEALFMLGLSYFMIGEQSSALHVWNLGKDRNPAFFRGRTFRTPADNMTPTLISGDLILIDNRYYANKKISRGDVVVFFYPDDEKNRLSISRVVGLPNEIVSIENKVVFTNGQKVLEKYKINKDEQYLGEPRDNMSKIALPDESYFLLGDNRDFSFDSRFFGPVKKELIIGRALIIYGSTPKETNLEGARNERIGLIIR